MFIRLRDKYARANKEVLLKCASPSSTETEVEKARRKLSRMYYLDWLEEFIKHRDRPGGVGKSRSAKTEEVDDYEDMKPPTMHTYGLDAPSSSSTVNSNIELHQRHSSSADDYRVFVVNNSTNHQDHHDHQQEGSQFVNEDVTNDGLAVTEDNSNHSSSNLAPPPAANKWCMSDLNNEDNKNNASEATATSRGPLKIQGPLVSEQRIVHRPTARNVTLYNNKDHQRQNKYTTSNHNSSRDPHDRHHRKIPPNVIPVLNHKLSERSGHRCSSDNNVSSSSRNNMPSSSSRNTYASINQQQSHIDDFDTFGRYLASKMRKLRYRLSEEEMEELEFDILNTLEKKRYNAAATTAVSRQQSSLSLSVSRKRNYTPLVSSEQEQPVPMVVTDHEYCPQDENDETSVPVAIDEVYEQQQQQQSPSPTPSS